MDQETTSPRLTRKGILFLVTIDGALRECVISKDALNQLAIQKNIDATDADPLELFQAFAVTISDAARRLGTGHPEGRNGKTIVLTSALPERE
jgi:Protein of unknown function (DUF1488)